MLQYLQPLLENSIKRKYYAGSTIYYQGEVPRSACILVGGIVRVYSISAQGDEQIVVYHVPGEILPSSYIFGKATSALFFYEALTTCDVCFVPKKDFLEYMQAKPERVNALLDYFTTNYSASLIHVNALEQPKARDKLLYILYYLCQRYAKQNSEKAQIPFALTHQNLASLVGLTRETTATEMNKLKKEGLLTYNSQKYVINMEKLLNLIGEDSFRKIDIGLNT
ncbi:Crp/Fnr family transcriptional regulator [Candidatus Parcubacteria bacterium]|nr:Crp/Fnr family transcriptional regulator [Candidatus Parcubacteria bacterium]